MKLVIDIHEKDYQSILNNGQVPYGVVYAIMNGTPLPKGHGRLIYAKDVGEYLTLADVPTIIEADKAESEDKE